MKQRKHTRLKEYDYSKNGYYFVTICVDKHKKILGTINVGRGLAPAGNKLSIYGKIVEKTLLEISNKYDKVKVDKYVIMPNHIHAIIQIENQMAGASPRPTLNDIVCTFKSIATRICNQEDRLCGRKIFQTSYYDHIIRNEYDYTQIWKYIDENPIKWTMDKYYE